MCAAFSDRRQEAAPVSARYYVGFDVHKRTIVIAVLDRAGKLIQEETIEANRRSLITWIEARRKPKETEIALEASGSSAWVTYILMAEEFRVTPVHPNH